MVRDKLKREACMRSQAEFGVADKLNSGADVVNNSLLRSCGKCNNRSV